MQSAQPVQQQSQTHTKALNRLATGQMQVDTNVSSQQASSQLTKMQQTKKQDRKVNEKDLDYIIQSFQINKIKATNILRKYDLQGAIAYLLQN